MQQQLRIGVIGKPGLDISDIEAHLQSAGIIVTCDKPQIILSVGGDGTFLKTEHAYPGIPKIILRRGSICKKCNKYTTSKEHIKEMVTRLKKKQYTVKTYHKAEAIIGTAKNNTTKIAVNDIIIRNKEPHHALRFRVTLAYGKKKDFIGDGVVFSTAFGSTGYFYSITRKRFYTGFAIGFNNTTEVQKPIAYQDPQIMIEIVRGDALVAADNLARHITVVPGHIIMLRKSQDRFSIITFDEFV